MAEKLKIIPLGGLDEIGKNITLLEYGKDMIAIDCGVGFPEEVGKYIAILPHHLSAYIQSMRCVVCI